MSAMRHTVYAWTLKSQDTPILGVRLHGRVVETGERVRLPRPTEHVSWAILWADGVQTLTTLPGGGLLTDDDGFVTWPQEQLVGRLGSVKRVKTYVQIIESDGRAQTYVAGTITIEA